MANGKGTDDKAAPGDQRMSGSLIRAIDHPLRRVLLRALHRSSEPRSPVQLSKETGESVGKIAYHVSILVLQGAAVKTGERQVRGARESFFTSTVAGHKQMVTILADTERDDDALGEAATDKDALDR